MNVYDFITNAIIEELENGVIPWHKPWTGSPDGAVSHATGKAYSILNQLFMRPGEYVTFAQCKAEGGRVKDGAKAKTVVFWKVLRLQEKDDAGNAVTDDDGKTIERNIPVLKYYHVFNVVEDCEGLELKWTHENHSPSSISPVARAEDVLADYVRREGITLENVRGDRAYYSPSQDLIHLPKLNQFTDPAEYYSTAFHEATHSTGHAKRLNRFTPFDTFGSESYSKEELTAEIGSACILHQLGIATPGTFKNSAAYIQGWLSALRNDKRLIVSAASRAEKAVTRIMEPTDAITLDDLAALIA